MCQANTWQDPFLQSGSSTALSRRASSAPPRPRARPGAPSGAGRHGRAPHRPSTAPIAPRTAPVLSSHCPRPAPAPGAARAGRGARSGRGITAPLRPAPPAMALRFSANLSWLFPELPALPARLEAAAAAGFGAVEAAWPAGCPAQELRAAAERARVRIALLNMPPGTAAALRSPVAVG